MPGEAELQEKIREQSRIFFTYQKSWKLKDPQLNDLSQFLEMETGKLTELINSAEAAQQRAVAPYSNFQVGAALETESGKIYSGCNIEVSSYGLTICAERVAIFKALSEGEKDFTQLVVTAKTRDFCPPCGACRQVLIDYAPNIKIFMLNSEGETKETTIAELLPEAFTRNFLSDSK